MELSDLAPCLILQVIMQSTEAAVVSSWPLTTSAVPTACTECEVLKALVDMDTK